MSSISGFNKYIDHLNQIRTLSSLSLNGIKDADDYSRHLRDNFVWIGRLAAENRPVLEEELYPLIEQTHMLTEEEESALIDFEEKLLDPENAECYDLAIAFLLSDRLLEEAMAMQDLLPKLRQMDMQISVCYTMMNMTARLTEYPEISRYYRQKGIELGQLFLVFREKENFAKIQEQEARELILTNARFTAAFYEIITGDEPRNNINLEMLRGSLRILEDPFYIDSVPGYDWRHYRYRLLFYFAQLTDYGNFRRFNESQFPEICDRTEELWDLWHTDPAYYSELDKESIVEFQLLKNRYYAGRITSSAYADGLHRIYLNRDKNAYDVKGIIENFQLPIEMYDIFRNKRFSAALKAQIAYYFNNMMAYIFHMPNSGSLHFLLELNTHVLARFVELPGKITFETMMLHMLAAFHPPTYVHSRMVAEFSVCLCDHLIRISPGLLIGIEDCQTEEEVLKNKDAILNYTWHAALCHDTGKLFIIDTIFVYGRKLLDTEFDLIKTHPGMGAATLGRFESTKKYTDVALGHHKWYDNSRGYPEDFDTGKSPVKTIIDIVQCADCLDAATDTVGRSYNRGKTFDDLYEEICEGSGTRYAPWLPELLSRPEVRIDIEYLLAAGRDQNYHDTYLLLKSMQEKEL